MVIQQQLTKNRMAEELKIYANLHITNAPNMAEDVIREQGLKLYAYAEGRINEDVYMTWDELLKRLEKLIIRVSGAVIFE